MMRNIQGYSVSRGYQPYPHPNSINRYPQVKIFKKKLSLTMDSISSESENENENENQKKIFLSTGPFSNGRNIISWYDATVFNES